MGRKLVTGIRKRPATQRACGLAKQVKLAPVVTEDAKRVVFGQDAGIVRLG